MKTRLIIIGFSCVLLMAAGCTHLRELKTNASDLSFSEPVQVVMIAMPDSSASIKLRTRLQDIAHKYRNFSFKVIDVLLLPDNDPRLQYGAPTVLYKGQDIFNAKKRSVQGITARVYSNVAPTEDEIIQGIQNMIHQDNAKSHDDQAGT